VKATFSVGQARAHLPELLRLAERQPLVIIRRGKKASVLMSADQLDAIFETLEIVSNPASLKVLRADRARKLQYLDLTELDEMLGRDAR
jgi:prevent-host-death family protein